MKFSEYVEAIRQGIYLDEMASSPAQAACKGRRHAVSGLMAVKSSAMWLVQGCCFAGNTGLLSGSDHGNSGGGCVLTRPYDDSIAAVGSADVWPTPETANRAIMLHRHGIVKLRMSVPISLLSLLDTHCSHTRPVLERPKMRPRRGAFTHSLSASLILFLCTACRTSFALNAQ